MIIDERKPLVDIIKENLIIISFAFIAFIIFFYMLISALMHINEAKKNIKIAKEIEEKKINIIKQSKPPIICNKKYIASDDYNIVSIDNKIIIETLESIGMPENSINLSNCVVYNKLTDNMVIPVTTSQEEKLLEEINTIKILNSNLQHESRILKSEISSLNNMIENKNSELKKLILMVESKQTKIDELMQYSIKYKEIKEYDLKERYYKLPKILRLSTQPIYEFVDLSKVYKYIYTTSKYLKDTEDSKRTIEAGGMVIPTFRS